ncbi:unnamed protein product [Trichobilharzia regenti]|nr:unnamed protein product [Trichobilharzia regenti]
MCEPSEVGDNGLIYSGVALKEIKYASISLSFINTLLNPFFIYLILNITLPGQLLSLLIMLQITFEWLKSLGEIIHFFCPVIKRTPELWFNILICHMWSSTFLYTLLELFCKQNVASMLIERCFYALMPDKDLIYYPKTIIAYHAFTLLYLLAINMGITIHVHVTPDGYSYLARLMVILNDFLGSIEMLSHLFALLFYVETIRSKFHTFVQYIFRRN